MIADLHNSSATEKSRTSVQRPRMTARIAVAPPYPGEFGWELMNWQARLRHLLDHLRLQKLIVCAPADRRALYDDPRITEVPVEEKIFTGHACDDRRIGEFGSPTSVDELSATAVESARRSLQAGGIDLPLDRADEVTVIMPEYRGKLWPTTPGFQRFVSLARTDERSKPTVDVVLMPRTRGAAADRNQPTTWWTELRERLESRGLSVAFAPNNLPDSIAMLSHCGLAAGGSTGGLHLASLCETPHLVWGPDDASRWTAWEFTNRQRYETIWNPLGTPMEYAPLGWRPDVATAATLITKALHRIGRGHMPARLRQRWQLAWRMRRFCMNWSYGENAECVPWRLRRVLTGAL